MNGQKSLRGVGFCWPTQDDVVWLAPFLTSNVSKMSRTRNTIIYVSVCLATRLQGDVLIVQVDAEDITHCQERNNGFLTSFMTMN